MIACIMEKNYGSVVIVDSKDKVIGIVTERDIVKKLVKNNMSPKTTKLEEIMTSNPRACTITTGLHKRSRKNILMDKEKLVGVISMRDIFYSINYLSNN